MGRREGGTMGASGAISRAGREWWRSAGLRTRIMNR